MVQFGSIIRALFKQQQLASKVDGTMLTALFVLLQCFCGTMLTALFVLLLFFYLFQYFYLSFSLLFSFIIVITILFCDYSCKVAG